MNIIAEQVKNKMIHRTKKRKTEHRYSCPDISEITRILNPRYSLPDISVDFNDIYVSRSLVYGIDCEERIDSYRLNWNCYKTKPLDPYPEPICSLKEIYGTDVC